MKVNLSGPIPTLQPPLITALVGIVRILVVIGFASASADVVSRQVTSPAAAASLWFWVFIGTAYGLWRAANRFLPFRALPLSPQSRMAHWGQMIEGLTLAPSAFYEEVVKAVETKAISDLSVSHVYAHEGGAFSEKRLYLTIERKDLIYLVCGAPFGNGFFVSSWLGTREGIAVLLASFTPFGTVLFPWLFRERTFYEVDTASMFQSLTHGALLSVVNNQVEAKGLRALSESEKKPILRDLLPSSGR